MSVPHDTFRDDLPAHALGALDTEAATRLERHLAGCAGCRRELREFQEVLRLLPLGLPRTEPSPAARRELFRRVRADAATAKRRAASGWWPGVRLHALTAAAVVIAVIGGALFWTLSNSDPGDDTAAIVENMRDNPDTQIIAMRGSEAAPQAVAQLFFQPGETRAGLVVSGLQPLPDGRAYQLWFIDPDETRYDGGVFSVDSGGQAMVVIEAPIGYAPGWNCGVTEEPASGSEWPTGRNVLRGSYEDYDW